jgi:alpha-beta hydrolase superfamily lysophospholipase
VTKVMRHPTIRGAVAAGAILLAVCLAGCAGQGTGHLSTSPSPAAAIPQQPVPPQAPRATEHFVADDGARLPLRVWRPEGKVTAAIVALHGMNDYSNAFAGPASAWAKHGIATYAYDQRGFGEGPKPGRWPGTWQLDDDAAAACKMVHRQEAGVPVYLLGESMGGAVAITAATGAVGAPKARCDGLILVAPAVWGRETMNVVERVALWTANAVDQDMTLTGRGLHVVASDNIPMLRALGRDPRVIKETRVGAIKGLVDLMDEALASAPHIHEPLLILYGGRDEVIPAEPMQLMVSRLPPGNVADRHIAWYPDGYHMLLRDLEAGPRIHDVESWIADHTAPLPSGADHDPKQIFASGS